MCLNDVRFMPTLCFFQVVGGADKGGILVRKGQDLKSEQLADRDLAAESGCMLAFIFGQCQLTRLHELVSFSVRRMGFVVAL